MKLIVTSSQQLDLALSAFTKIGHFKKEDALGNGEVIIENSLATNKDSYSFIYSARILTLKNPKKYKF